MNNVQSQQISPTKLDIVTQVKTRKIEAAEMLASKRLKGSDQGNEHFSLIRKKGIQIIVQYRLFLLGETFLPILVRSTHLY